MKALALLALFVVALQAGFLFTISSQGTSSAAAPAHVEVAHRAPPAPAAMPARS